MALTLNSNWLNALAYNASPRVRFLVSIYTTTSPRKFVDGECDAFYYPSSVVEVTPVERKFEPLKRTASTSEITLTLTLDDIVKAMLVADALVGTRVVVELGERSLAEADFEPFWAGVIDDTIADDTRVVLPCSPAQRIVRGRRFFASYIGQHPLEVITDAMGLVPSDLWDSASLLPSAHPTISHFVISRGIMADGVNVRGVDMRENWLPAIDEICEMLQGSFVPQEDGVATFTRFDPTASAVADWGDDDLGADVELLTVYDDLINSVTITTHHDELSNARGTFLDAKEVATSISDATSKSAYPYRNSGGSADTTRERTLDNAWATAFSAAYAHGAVKNAPTVVDWTDVSPAVNNWLVLNGVGGIHSICGTRWASYPGGSQDSDAEASASRPVYLQIDQEIVKCETVELGGSSQVARFKAIGGPGAGLPADYVTRPAFLNVQVDERGALGTTAAAHVWPKEKGQPKRPVYDVTIQVYTAQTILARCKDGMPLVRVSTSLAQYAVQLADLVTLTTSRLRWLGHDGVDSNVKWEVIGKKVLLFDREPRIEWLLAFASDSAAAATSESVEIANFEQAGIMSQLREGRFGEDFMLRSTPSGFGSSTASLDATISAGQMVGAQGTAVLGEDVTLTLTNNTTSSWVYFDMESQSLVVREAATQPVYTGPTEVLIWEYVTSGGSITGETDHRSARAVSGARLLTQTVDTEEVAAEALRWGHLDGQLDVQGNLIKNGSFEHWAEEITPGAREKPDNWSWLGALQIGEGRESSTVQSGVYSLKFGADSSGVISAPVPAGPDIYSAGVIARVSTVTGNTHLTVFVAEYDVSRNKIAATEKYIYNDTELAASGTWFSKIIKFRLTNASTRYIAMEIKPGATADSVSVAYYFDKAFIRPAFSTFEAYRDISNQTIATGSATKVEYNAEAADPGGDYDHTTSYQYTAPEDGEYSFAGSAFVVSLASGSRARLDLYVNGTRTVGGADHWNNTGSAQSIRARNDVQGLTLAVGDTVEMRVFHDHGSNRFVQSGSADTWFKGVQTKGFG